MRLPPMRTHVDMIVSIPLMIAGCAFSDSAVDRSATVMFASHGDAGFWRTALGLGTVVSLAAALGYYAYSNAQSTKAKTKSVKAKTNTNKGKVTASSSAKVSVEDDDIKDEIGGADTLRGNLTGRNC